MGPEPSHSTPDAPPSPPPHSTGQPSTEPAEQQSTETTAPATEQVKMSPVDPTPESDSAQSEQVSPAGLACVDRRQLGQLSSQLTQIYTDSPNHHQHAYAHALCRADPDPAPLDPPHRPLQTAHLPRQVLPPSLLRRPLLLSSLPGLARGVLCADAERAAAGLRGAGRQAGEARRRALAHAEAEGQGRGGEE